MKKKNADKSFLEYKKELEIILEKMNDSEYDFEEMLLFYHQGIEIISILETKLEKAKISPIIVE